MLKVRAEYERIFTDIEGPNCDIHVEWPIKRDGLSVLVYPQFVSKKSFEQNSRKQAAAKLVNQEPQKEETTSAASSEIVKLDDARRFEDVERVKLECDLEDEKVRFLQLENLENMEKSELLSIREGVSLELLWIQQAIQSRVQVFEILSRDFIRSNRLIG